MTSQSRQQRTPVIRYRRSPAIVVYWSEEGLVCFSPARAERRLVEPRMVSFLDRLTDWQSPAALAELAPALGPPASIEGLLHEMENIGLVESDQDSQEWPWAKWSPEAAFFHFGTRDRSYPQDPLLYHDFLAQRALVDPPPPPTKTMPGRRIRLKRPSSLGTLSTTLLARRTWRNFGSSPVSLSDLATLLQLTWGVQKWAAVKGEGRVALKTSPSGGARHSIEAYVLALNVKGLKPGMYHYDAASHELVDLKQRVSRETASRLLANQFYYGHAGAMIFMSAVVARAMWRYPFSRAFRSLLTEAGHLGQTFCLTATALKLAPFVSMAFFEAEIERLIGIDGVNESVIYAVGVGSRPDGRKKTDPGRLPVSGPGPRVHVRLNLFSGQPNPEWTMSGDKAVDMQNKLYGLPPLAVESRNRKPRLGYRGFSITFTNGDQTPQRFDLYKGWAVDYQRNIIRADTDRSLESAVYLTAPPAVIERLDNMSFALLSTEGNEVPIAGLKKPDSAKIGCANGPIAMGGQPWTTFTIVNNCYNYANDILNKNPFGAPAMPGSLSSLPTGKTNAQIKTLLRAEIKKDGLVLYRTNKVPAGCPPANKHYMAVIMRHAPGSTNVQDFHCLRLDKDGTWSHKNDVLEPRNTDDAGASPNTGDVITDLTLAKFDGDPVLVGVFKAKKPNTSIG